jgi:hypothetical protein
MQASLALPNAKYHGQQHEYKTTASRQEDISATYLSPHPTRNAISKLNLPDSPIAGGTCTCVTGPWATRIMDRGCDPSCMGRWSFVTLIGRYNRKLTIVTAYRVHNTTIGCAGPWTSYRQQWLALRASGHEQPNPRLQFIKDMTNFIQARQDQGEAVILMLDANETLGAETEGISSLMTKCDLTNSLSRIYGQAATKHRDPITQHKERDN